MLNFKRNKNINEFKNFYGQNLNFTWIFNMLEKNKQSFIKAQVDNFKKL
jgi:hypothetical protein